MSRQELKHFVKDLRKFAKEHGVRIGFVTLDDGERNVCSALGIENEDKLRDAHLESLKMAIMALRDD